ICIKHRALSIKNFYGKSAQKILFCDNETNNQRLYKSENSGKYCKDGINDYVINGNENAVNPEKKSTKAAFFIDEIIPAKSTKIFEFRLSDKDVENPFEKCDETFSKRKDEADEFY